MTSASIVASLLACLLYLVLVAEAQTIPRMPMAQRNTSRKAFSFTQTRNPNWVPRQIPVTSIYAAPFIKHHLRMPEPLKEAVDELQASGDNNNSSLRHKRANGWKATGTNGLYAFPVSIGNPAQTFNILFDTGSGDFWVWSWLLPQQLATGRHLYNATKSTASARWAGQSFNVDYTSGSAYGLVWQDDLVVNGEDALGLTGNPIECTQNIGGTNLPALTGVDGIMGLNTWTTDSETPAPQQTWLNFIISLNLLQDPLFTVALVKGGVGTMDFGFIDAKKYTGNIVYSPVVPLPDWAGSGYWLVNWSGYSIGKGSFNTTINQVFVDTGSNLVLLPQSMTNRYYAQVKGAWQQTNGFWMFPCATNLPTFTFGIGSARFTIKAKNMVYLNLDDGINCLGAIQQTDEDSYILIGTPWLEGLFMVHDYGGKRLGFATRP